MDNFKRKQVLSESMGKIVRIGGRGTSRRVTEKDSDNWSGEGFREISRKRKEASKDAYVSVGRGTKKVKFGDIADTRTSSTKGRYVSSGRGTGRRKIQ